MKRLVEFPLEDGTTMMVEVDTVEASSVRVRGAKKTIQKAKQTFEISLYGIKPTAAAIIAKLREPGDKPETIGVNLASS